MAKGDMSAQEYYDKYGYKRNQPGWDDLTDTDKGIIKKQRPFYQGPGEREQRLTEDWYEKYQAGPDTNIWKGLSKMLGIKPGAIKSFAMGKLGELFERPDFGEEYGLKAEDLERGLAEQFAGRGLLDSSMMGTAMGSGMSELMKERAMMEESAWMNRLGKAGGFVGQGVDFAKFLNTQYLQDLGLGAEAIAYLTGEREREMGFEMERYAIDPNINDPITGLEAILGIVNAGVGAYGAFGGGGFGGGGGGGGNFNIPTQPENTWENYDWFGS